MIAVREEDAYVNRTHNSWDIQIFQNNKKDSCSENSFVPKLRHLLKSLQHIVIILLFSTSMGNTTDINDILSKSTKREDQSISYFLETEVNVFYAAGSNQDYEYEQTFVYNYYFDGMEKMRIDKSMEYVPMENGLHKLDKTITRIFNGELQYIVDKSHGYRSITIQKEDVTKNIRKATRYSLALGMALPDFLSNVLERDLDISLDPDIHNRHLHLNVRDSQNGVSFSLSLDSDAAYYPTSIEVLHNGNLVERRSSTPIEVSEGIWLPATGLLEQYTLVNNKYKLTNKEEMYLIDYTINEEIPSEVFEISFVHGDHVGDKRSGVNYVVGGDEKLLKRLTDDVMDDTYSILNQASSQGAERPQPRTNRERDISKLTINENSGASSRVIGKLLVVIISVTLIIALMLRKTNYNNEA